MFEEVRRGEYADYSATPSSGNAEDTLLRRFHKHFRAVSADTSELIRRAQEIRYQVYCVERQFENSEDHPDGREKDHFDTHSVHSLLIHRTTGEAVGTVRLVLPRRDKLENSFVIQRVTDPLVLAASPLPLQRTGEVSRFSISKQFRTDKSIQGQHGPLLSLGLIQTLVSMSARYRITHWCAVMEPKLLRMLAAMAIHFTPIGGRVEYHGLRQPSYCHVATVLDRVKRERPMFWQVLTDGGDLEGRRWFG